MALTLMICPHDTAHNPERWYRLVQYLTPRLGEEIHLELSLDFEDFRANLGQADLVYANPSDALALMANRGFAPVVRPEGRYDEALYVCGPEVAGAGPEALAGAPVVTVTTMLPAKLALRALAGRGLTPGELIHRDSWQGVIGAVYRGEAPFGIVYRDTYEDLSEAGRAMVRVLGATEERAAFHCLVAGPKALPLRARLAELLTAMAADPVGAEVLADLEQRGWAAVGADDLRPVAALARG